MTIHINEKILTKKKLWIGMAVVVAQHCPCAYNVPPSGTLKNARNGKYWVCITTIKNKISKVAVL